MKPIVSIKEARTLLGSDAESLSDDEVLSLITQLDELARIALATARENIAKKHKRLTDE